MAKRDLLFLAHRIPYPPDKGDKIRSWHLLRHLAQRWRVHLGCFVDDINDMQYTDFLRDMTQSSCFVPINPAIARVKSLLGLVTGTPLSFEFYKSSTMRKYVRSVYDAQSLAGQLAFSSAMAPFLIDTQSGVPTLIDFCDSDAEKWRAYADRKKGPMRLIYQREATLLAAQETRLANEANASFAITDSEARLFNERAGISRTVGVFGNGVDTDYYDPSLPIGLGKSEPADLVFVGAMDYAPNCEAVIWFADNVWPLILRDYPSARFAIVGSKPAAPVRALAQRQGVHVTGRVEDVRPWISTAKLSVAPLQIARGIQNKVLEAMAMGKPVVATCAAAEGIDATDGTHFMLHDDPVQMADTVCELLGDTARRADIGTAARAHITAHYGWQAKLARIDRSLDAIVQHSG